MPVVIAIAILVITRRLARRPRRHYLPVYDPIKEQKEKDRQRREQERQEDRQRKEIDRKRKEEERAAKAAERERKAQEERRAANDKYNWLCGMIERYSQLSEDIDKELSENPSLTEYKRIQLQQKALQTEEKIRRYSEQRDKAYFTAHSPVDKC